MRTFIAFWLMVSAASGQTIRRLDGSTITGTKAAAIADQELAVDKVMGAQIAILNRGRVVWTHVYGLRDASKQLPMTADSNIWAASITKSVFATWVMQLVEQHRLNLDQPIARMLPRPLNTYEPYADSASEIVKDPQWQLITPRHLLSLSSGLSNIVAVTEPDHKLRIHFKPGTQFVYSGDGLNLLQFAIEEGIIHDKLENAMQRDLFTPLRMTRTGLVWHENFAIDLALRYDAWGKYLDTTHRDHSRAAGSMATTITDLGRFTEALLAGKLLQPASQKVMFTQQVSINIAHQFPGAIIDPTTSAEGPGVGLAYGLGWGMLTHTKFGPAFFKEGHGNGAENYLICFVKSQTCMILLTNSDNGELAFRPLLEQLIGDSVTPWVWEAYTREQVLHNDEHTAK